MNQLIKTAALLGLLAGAFALSGCVLAIGNEPAPIPAKHGATLGQELMDLQKARDAGVITETEYQAQREKLLGPGAHK